MVTQVSLPFEFIALDVASGCGTVLYEFLDNALPFRVTIGLFVNLCTFRLDLVDFPMAIRNTCPALCSAGQVGLVVPCLEVVCCPNAEIALEITRDIRLDNRLAAIGARAVRNVFIIMRVEEVVHKGHHFPAPVLFTDAD